MAWLRDLRYAARALQAHKGFAAAVVLTMALAIGAVTGVFTVAKAVLFRPLPFPDPSRIVAVSTIRENADSRISGVSIEELRDWQAQSKTIAAFCGWRSWGMLRYSGAEHEGVYSLIVTPDLFRVFPARPVLGRLFEAADDAPGRNRVVLLAYPYWRDHFGSDPGVVGKTMELEREDRATYTIVGVLPPQFGDVPTFDGVKLFALSSSDPGAATGRSHHNRQVFARLAAGASLSGARAEMHVIAQRLAVRYPESNHGVDARVVPIIDHEVGPAADTLRAFLGAVAFLLVIACANVAGLQLVRALGRRREFSIRQALGGSRAAVMRVLVAESVLAALVAGVAGLFLASWLVDLVLGAGPAIARAEAVRFDGGVFAFALAVCFGAGLTAALPAALLTTRLDLVRALKEESAQAGRAVRARTLFVAGQVALALVLLTGAVAAGETLVRQLTIRPGFDANGLAAIQMFPPKQRYDTGPHVAAFYARVLDEIRGVSGVTAASAVSAPPLSGEGSEPVEFAVEGDAAGALPHVANSFNAAAGYFSALGAPLRAGRDFTDRDGPSAPAVAIVNETFVRRYLAGRDPLRSTVRLKPAGVVQIVAVAPDLLQNATPHAAPEPEIYWPYSQRPRWATFVVLRAANPDAAVTARRRIQALDAENSVSAPVFMTERIARSARGPRFVALLFSLFAASALVLSAIAVAGLVLYALTQRSRELAVRVSLGASRGDVLRTIAAGPFRAVVLGSLVGVAATAVFARLAGAAIPQLEPAGTGTLAAAWLLLVSFGWVACYVPARRALEVDPADALRLE